MQNQPLHGAPKENPQLQEVDEMLAQLKRLRSELAVEVNVNVGSPFFCGDLERGAPLECETTSS